MPTDETFEFQCPKCAKRLKAGAQVAGKRVKCPKCGQAVKVPGLPSEPPPYAVLDEPAPPPPELGPVPVNLDDDWLNLGSPAISDLPDRQKVVLDNKAAKERERAARQNRERARREIPELDSAEVKRPHSMAAKQTELAMPGRSAAAGTPPAEQAASHRQTQEPNATTLEAASQQRLQQATAQAAGSESDPPPPRSLFDDDLPELAELDAAPRPNAHSQKLLREHGGDAADAEPRRKSSGTQPPRPSPHKSSSGGDAAKTRPAPKAPAAEPLDLPPLYEDEPAAADPEYRIVCPTCNTAQYVHLSMKGMKIKCPDCFSQFKVPPPPPTAKKKKLELSTEPDLPFAAGEELHQAELRETHRNRASQMLEKAQREISDEDIDNLYGGDFDTAGFMQRTFGFLKDPIAVAQIVGYGLVFGGVFALAQFGADNADNGFGRGVLLLAVIAAPVIAILFAMPMLSGALALLESVANRQPKVTEWPGFNLFDNAGDMIGILVALIGSTVPGFLLGSWLAGEAEGGGRIIISGMMLTSFILFPVFLLSMLDNGSLFAPLSSSIFRSFTAAAEAWGGYFLKTFVAFSLTMLLWFLLLGHGPGLASLAGFLLPLLVFFTCQQIGALADGISEHLSFEFTPPDRDDDEDDAEV